MHYLRQAFILVLSLAAGAAVAEPQQPPKDLVKAALVADVTSVVPGRPLTLGVLFVMKPEWHIYWHNPGESGLATSVRFDLPEGINAGPVLWPAPTRFIQPGDILGYGYIESVLLAARVMVANDLSGKSVPIRAKVRWLACKDVCIPGSADLEWSMPVSAASAPSNSSLFSKWQEILPVEAFSAGVQASLAGTLSEDGSESELEITLDFRDPPANLQWFPYEYNAIRIKDAAVETEGTRASVRFMAARLKGQEQAFPDLLSVVSYDDPNGKRRAVRVTLSIQGGN